MKVLDILEQSDELRENLMKNTHYLRETFAGAGLAVLGHDDCPIVPVLLGDAVKAKQMSELLMDRGIYAVNFSYPVVPHGAARIRFQVSAAHTQKQLQKCAAAVIGSSKEVQERFNFKFCF